MQPSNTKEIAAIKRSLKDLMEYQCEIDARVMELEETLDSMAAVRVQLLKPQPQGNPFTDYQVEQLAHRTCWRYRHSSDPAHSSTYTFNRHTLLEFVRALREGGAA